MLSWWYLHENDVTSLGSQSKTPSTSSEHFAACSKQMLAPYYLIFCSMDVIARQIIWGLSLVIYSVYLSPRPGKNLRWPQTPGARWNRQGSGFEVYLGTFFASLWPEYPNPWTLWPSFLSVWQGRSECTLVTQHLLLASSTGPSQEHSVCGAWTNWQTRTALSRRQAPQLTFHRESRGGLRRGKKADWAQSTALDDFGSRSVNNKREQKGKKNLGRKLKIQICIKTECLPTSLLAFPWLFFLFWQGAFSSPGQGWEIMLFLVGVNATSLRRTAQLLRPTCPETSSAASMSQSHPKKASSALAAAEANSTAGHRRGFFFRPSGCPLSLRSLYSGQNYSRYVLQISSRKENHQQLKAEQSMSALPQPGTWSRSSRPVEEIQRPEKD